MSEPDGDSSSRSWYPQGVTHRTSSQSVATPSDRFAARAQQPCPDLPPTIFQKSRPNRANFPSLWSRGVYVTVRRLFFSTGPVGGGASSKQPTSRRCSSVRRFHAVIRAQTRAAVNLRIWSRSATRHLTFSHTFMLSLLASCLKREKREIRRLSWLSRLSSQQSREQESQSIGRRTSVFTHIVHMYICAGIWPGHGTRPSDEHKEGTAALCPSRKTAH